MAKPNSSEVPALTCTINNCSKELKSPASLRQHIYRMHWEISEHLAPLDMVQSVPVDVFKNDQLPHGIHGGFWESVLGSTNFWLANVIVLVFAVTLGFASGIGAGVAIGLSAPLFGLAGWYIDQRNTYVMVCRIKPPFDDLGQVLIVEEFWPVTEARKLPKEARWKVGGQVQYWIDELNPDNPIVYNPFSTPPPDYAIPARGAMVNQQTDNEALNVGHFKGLRPEVVKTAFAGLVIAGLLLANVAMFNSLLEYMQS